MAKTYSLEIPIRSGHSKTTQISSGQVAFVLGANGAGKSSLLERFFRSSGGTAKWILAQRTIWFHHGISTFSAQQRLNVLDQIGRHNSGMNVRHSDLGYNERTNFTLSEIVRLENLRARRLADALHSDQEAFKKIAEGKSPLQIINGILDRCNTSLSLSLNEQEEFLVSKCHGDPYNMSLLSDGEKNVILLCAEIISTEKNSLVLIDEPDRHLHRSIISSLLAALLAERSDCAFVVATHDTTLPINYPNANVILVRRIFPIGDEEIYWDIDIIKSTDNIPDDIKKEILGAKRKILFVEGTAGSLDKSLYQILFPEVTVMPMASCSDVMEAVEGIKATSGLNWVEAFGLIDADDRTGEQIIKLERKGVYTVNAYSVEYLYYNPTTIRAVANKHADSVGKNGEDLFKSAISGIISMMEKERESLCARVCEKSMRNQVMNQLPKHKDIKARKPLSIAIDPVKSYDAELVKFDALVAVSDIDGLLSRYPLRMSPTIGEIVNKIGLSREDYEGMVRKIVQDDSILANDMRSKVNSLTNAIRPATVLVTIPVAAAANPDETAPA